MREYKIALSCAMLRSELLLIDCVRTARIKFSDEQTFCCSVLVSGVHFGESAVKCIAVQLRASVDPLRYDTVRGV